MKKEIKGCKIRWQFFNIPMYALIVIFFVLVIAFFSTSLANGNFEASKYLSNVFLSAKILVSFALPFVVLSVLNRYCFGKTVCVLSEEGIHCRNAFIEWNKVIKVEYEIELPSKTRMNFSYAKIVTENEDIKIVHAPLYILSKIKKMQPHIKTEITKSSKFFVIIIAGSLLLISAALPFIAS